MGNFSSIRPFYKRNPGEVWELYDDEVVKAINAIVSPDDVFEIRILGGRSSKYNASGYFDSARAALTALKEYRPSSQYKRQKAEKASIYITLNPVKLECYSRSQCGAIVEDAQPTTADKDIVKYKWFFIDLDPVRTSDISSSDAELQKALEKSRDIKAYMREMGWTSPLHAFSGNGVHLLYRIDLPNTAETTELIGAALDGLNQKFSDDDVKVDTANKNAARICKLYGTIAKKGADDPKHKRPHRPAALIKSDFDTAVNGVHLLEELAALRKPAQVDKPAKPATSSTRSKAPNSSTGSTSDQEKSIAFVQSFVDKHSIPLRGTHTKDGNFFFDLEHCVFDESHAGSDACIFVQTDGKICYKCQHDHCQQYSWHDVREKYEPGYKDQKKSMDDWDGDTLNAENFRRYLQKKGYELKYNTVLHSIEYRGIAGIAAEHLDNDFPLVCYDELHRELKRVNPKICGQYVKMIANQSEYNPVIDAVSRTSWDGIDRLPRLYEVMGIPDDDALSRVFMRKWMMQGIALQHNTLDAAISTELVLILYGAQNIGKTSLLRKLAISPALFREGHQLNPSDKDSLSQGVSSFICELGELARTMKKDPDTLKAFFTLPADKWRSPYAASPETHPRRTIFAGTVNDDRFLVDPTGNRRFAVIPLDSMDYRKVIAMSDSDVLQLWAQINAEVENIVKDGGSYAGCFRLTPEERQMQETRNNRFMKLATAQSEVEDILAGVDMSPNAYKWKDSTVLEWKSYFGCLDRYTPESVGKALTAAGIEAQKPKKVDGKPVRLRNLPFPIRKPSMIIMNGDEIEEAPIL